MTVLDIRNEIVGKLCKKPTVTLSDCVNINVPKAFEGSKFGLIRAALEELIEIGMIHEITPDDDSEPFWILSAPIGSSGQNVHIEMDTAHNIANIINGYLTANKISDVRADALKIEERDILMIVGILGDILMIDPDVVKKKKEENPSEETDEEIDPDA